jgi:cell division septal protein FtsQ
MARKQARRRKPRKTRQIKLPTIRVGRLIAPLAAVGVVLATYQASLALLDRPIASIEISGPFQRVSALQIEEAISDAVDVGFVGADLGGIQSGAGARGNLGPERPVEYAR